MKHNITSVFIVLVILVILVICFMAIAFVLNSSAQEEYFTYLPLVYKPVDPQATPTATPIPRPTALPTPRLATVYWNNKDMNGYPACYEVLGTGIGQKCRPIADIWRLYGTFPVGTYQVQHGSLRCKLKAYERFFWPGTHNVTLFCEMP